MSTRRVGSMIASLALLAVAARAAEADDRAGGRADTAAIAPQVTGGRVVPAGKWADAAGVYFDENVGCSGTLIAPNLVLTAGHCIDDSVGQVIVDSVRYDVGEHIPVVQRFMNPGIDVGLLVLGRDATVEPRVIAADCVLDRYATNGGAVAIVGWGATDFNAQQFPYNLMEAETTILDVDCTGPQAQLNGCAFAGQEIIAGGGGIDSCNGDSGGPLYLLAGDDAYLIGVTSRALDTATQLCGQGGVYTRADAAVAWIEQVSGVTLAAPACNEPPVLAMATLALEVEAGDTVRALIEATDPDGDGAALDFRVGAAPEHGEAELADDGTLSFTASDDFEGTDALTVVVTDRGSPAESASVLVNVTIVPAEGGCDGCAADGGNATSTAALAVGLAALLWPRRRRRRAG